MDIVFKCRASAVGKIMTEPQGKTSKQKYYEAVEKLSSLKTRLNAFANPDCKTAVDIRENQIPKTEALVCELEKVKDQVELSETCKQYLKEWILEHKYGRRKEFGNKYTDKGNKTEQAGFQLIQDVLFNGVFLPKNKMWYEDDYFTGVPDIEILQWIIDNKSSWNLFTFPIAEIEPPDKANEPQVRVYIRLADKESGLVCYTLNDTPPELVEDEIWKYKRQKGLIDITDAEAYSVVKNHVYTREGLKSCQYLFGTHDTSDFIEIPKEKRLVKFEYSRDMDIENAMVARVKICQQWVKENYDKF